MVKIKYHSFRDEAKHSTNGAFDRWFAIDRYCGDKRIYILIKHHGFVIDPKSDWFEGIASGIREKLRRAEDE